MNDDRRAASLWARRAAFGLAATFVLYAAGLAASVLTGSVALFTLVCTPLALAFSIAGVVAFIAGARGRSVSIAILGVLAVLAAIVSWVPMGVLFAVGGSTA